MNIFIVLTGILLLSFGISDWRKKAVPIMHLIVGGILTLVVIFIWNENPIYFYISALMPGIGLILLAFLTKDKLGYADGITVLLVGALRGLVLCLQSLMLALFLLMCVFGVLIACKKADRKTKLPFIPFLFFSWCLTEVFRETVFRMTGGKI